MTTAPTPPADLADSLARALRLAPGAGESLDSFGERHIVKIDGARSGGAFALFELITPPGAGPPLHIHHREDETFMVLEGRAEFLIGDRRFHAEPGAVVFGPRGVAHTFRNAGEGDLRMYMMTSPSGFEFFFREAAEVFAAGPPDEAAAAALLGKYGMDLVGPPLS